MRLLWRLLLPLSLFLVGTASHNYRQDRREEEQKILRLLLKALNEDYGNDPVLKEASRFLNDFIQQADLLTRDMALYEYIFSTNVTNENSKKVEDEEVLFSAFLTAQKPKAIDFYKQSGNWSYEIRRQFKFIAEIVVAADPKVTREMAELSSNLSSIYANAKVCEKSGNRCHDLEPDLLNTMANSRDYEELLWAWKGWHDATGPKMKSMYTRLVDLMNVEAKDNGYADEAAIWMEENDETDPAGFEARCDKYLAEIMPLYKELHAYVRGRLEKTYGSDRVQSNKPIPAHLLGNMWAQDWSSINPLVSPYTNKLFQEAEKGMQDRSLKAIDLFKMAEEFYTSIGLLPMTDAFWKYSMLTKPTDGRVVQCHAAAHDMSTGKDFRIHMCAEINMFHFYVIHHEMGHVEYYMEYANQPNMFRSGAHSGFHEAIGDTIGLSVVTPKHLATIGLVDAGQDTYENSISFLLNLALQKVAFLPFGYTIDKWRWRVFRGDIKPDDYTTSWWNMHREYRGVVPPVPRDDPSLFDAGAKYHVPANVPYSRYFISHLLQFHFHEALCAAAGHKGALHKCDIYRSKVAGNRFSKMLKMGASRPWPDALEVLTGSRKFDTGPLLRYFEPLRQWLSEQNKKNNYPVGW